MPEAGQKFVAGPRGADAPVGKLGRQVGPDRFKVRPKEQRCQPIERGRRTCCEGYVLRGTGFCCKIIGPQL